jgi:hypothetical protein
VLKIEVVRRRAILIASEGAKGREIDSPKTGENAAK